MLTGTRLVGEVLKIPVSFLISSSRLWMRWLGSLMAGRRGVVVSGLVKRSEEEKESVLAPSESDWDEMLSRRCCLVGGRFFPGR